MLRRIYVDNFKALRDFSVDLDDSVQLWAGENGSGKSSVLEAVGSFCVLGLRRPLSDIAAFADVERRGEEQTVEITLDIQGKTAQWGLKVGRAGATFGVIEEWVELGGSRLLTAHAAGDDDLSVTLQFDGGGTGGLNVRRNQAALGIIAENDETRLLTAIRKRLLGIRIVSPNPWAMRRPTPGQTHVLEMTDFAAFEDHYSEMRKPDAERALTALRAAITGFQSLSFSGDRATATFKYGSRNVVVPFASLSEGQLALIALYSASSAFLCDGATLFLDEPENFISSRELQPWLRSVEDRLAELEDANESAQVVIVSHHPELLDLLARRRGTWFTRADDGRVATRKWAAGTSELSPSELVARGWADDEASKAR